MKRLLIIAALLLGAAPPMALASQGGRGEETGQGQVPLSRVLAMIAQRFPGRQLNTTMGDSGGRPVYIVQWLLTNGKIVVFTVDARTGQVMSQ